MSTLVEGRRLTRPAKGWRNIYWLSCALWVDDEWRGPGRTASKFVWPSKDIAETMAEKKRTEWEPLGAKYLGAEQEL